VTDTQLLERLGAAYASVAAPAPSAELAARMARGGRVGDADDDSTRDAVVVPLVVRRPRTRLRYSIAAAVAAFALFSGLAVAGALPDPVQRQVSSFASHFGLDLPAPGGTERGSSAPGKSTTPVTAPLTLPVTTESVVPPAAGATATPATPSPAPTAAQVAGALTGTLGRVCAVGGSVATTVPSTAGSPLPEPTVTVPPPTVPPATLPSTTLPPATLPPVTLPQLPPLTLPGL